MLNDDFQVKPIQTSEASLVLDFLKTAQFSHRHLDWRLPIDWLGTQPYLGCWYRDDLIALLICPITETKEVWIRCYAGNSFHSTRAAWTKLLQESIQLLHKKDIDFIYTICLGSWYEELIINSGFQIVNEIVVLEKSNWATRPLRLPPEEIQIHDMESHHLHEVYELDRKCFHPIWQLTKEDIEIAYKHAINCTVAYDEDSTLIAYQISNLIGDTAHLARIAVLPSYQRKSIGQMLLNNMLKRFAQMGIMKVTVNTQSDNQASLQLYKQNGFTITDERYPVYIYRI